MEGIIMVNMDFIKTRARALTRRARGQEDGYVRCKGEPVQVRRRRQKGF